VADRAGTGWYVTVTVAFGEGEALWDGVGLVPEVLDRVTRVLRLVQVPPNLRDAPQPGDLTADEDGPFDTWFDGGAIRMITGHTEYRFLDGARASRPVVSGLRLFISFADGREVAVTSDSEVGVR
jgi:hypothetical protein